jgi:hypothetical protein
MEGLFGVSHYYCTPVIMPSLLRYNRSFTEEAQKRLATPLGAPVSKPQTPLQRSQKPLDYVAASLTSGSGKTNSIKSARLQYRLIRGLSKTKPRSSICCEWPLSCHQRRWIKIGYSGMAIDR